MDNQNYVSVPREPTADQKHEGLKACAETELDPSWEELTIVYKAMIAAAPAPEAKDAEFKNFHRMLCERFNYQHDPVDWKRDQISLMEWIAKKTAPLDREAIRRQALEESGGKCVWKVTTGSGETCHFGHFGLAKSYAGETGTVKEIPIRSFNLIQQETAEQPKCEKCGGSTCAMYGVEGTVMCNSCDHVQDVKQADQPQAQDEREAFEQKAQSRGLSLSRNAYGHYEYWVTNEAWEAWLARASLPAKVEQQPEPAAYICDMPSLGRKMAFLPDELNPEIGMRSESIVPLYASPQAQPKLTDEEIVAAAKEACGTGRVSLIFTNNEDKEVPTDVARCFARALLAAREGKCES